MSHSGLPDLEVGEGWPREPDRRGDMEGPCLERLPLRPGIKPTGGRER